MDVTLLPYTAIDGIPTMTDSEVMSLFDLMEDDGTAEVVYADGSITNSKGFLMDMKMGLNKLYVVQVDKEVAGIIWLNNFDFRSSMIHFCFFSSGWKFDLVKVGKTCVLELLNMNFFDILTGVVPVINERANEWCRKMGFSVLGTMPSYCWIESQRKSVPGNIYYVERGKYG